MPLNPLSLRDFPLSGGHRLHYIPAGGSTAAIFKENLADVPPRRLMQAKPALPLNPSQHTLTAPFRGHTASALLQRASPLFDFHRKSHCRSNAARDRAYSNVDSSLQIIADVPPRRLMPPSLMWIPSTNNIADVDFANAKPLNPSRFQQQAGPCQAF